MIYKECVKGQFISRPNRFIAVVNIEGEEIKCHVKNTGRCKELLIKGATVYLEKATNSKRKTPYSIIAVEKGDLLINMDSQAPNKVVHEWLKKEELIKNIALIKPEKTFLGSRFDFYVETQNGEKHFIEVKGVTLEHEGKVSFPDAPTTRGTRHINELVEAISMGYKSHVVFVVQMEKAEEFSPNSSNDPDFANALKNARNKGVDIIAVTCKVTPNSLEILEKLNNVYI